MLFKELWAKWIEMKKPVVKETTLSTYVDTGRNHFLPDMGDLLIEDITSEYIASYLIGKKARLKSKTVADMRTILKQILLYAKTQQIITEVPVFPKMSAKPPHIEVFTKAEQEKIEDEVVKEDTPYTSGILLSLYGGLRIGEVCGLRWEDFDFQNKTVSIRRTVSRITDVDASGTKVVITTPKTDCSLRTIPLPSDVFHFLEEKREDGALYVTTGKLKPMEPRNCRRRFQVLLKKAGVTPHTWHCLRHTFATRCVENEVDIKSLSEILGHSDVSITMQRYVHPSLDFKQEQVNKLTVFGDIKAS